MRSRTRLLIGLGFAVFVFLAVSALLARALTGAGTERAQVLDVLEAQARGDADGMLAQMPACRAEPACVQVTRDRAEELARPGAVEILQYAPSVRVALTERTGTGRVAWRAGDSPPVVQCVRARRTGPLAGASAEIMALSAPIGGEEGC